MLVSERMKLVNSRDKYIRAEVTFLTYFNYYFYFCVNILDYFLSTC